MISDIVYIVGLTALAGICIPIGGLLARSERISPNWLEQEFRHFLIALGGGVLLGAVTIVLIPEGQSSIGNSFWAIPAIIAGGVLFFGFERMLGVHHKEAPQLMGVMLDFVPEAAALGGLIVINPELAPLMAVLIAMQNLPEGFNAYREFCNRPGYTPGKTLVAMTGLAAVGPIAGLSGYFFLSGQPVILGTIMLVASGGILYLIFQDIAPQSRLEKHWAPPLGAVIGFCLALFSNMLVAHA
jgi:ZIP family zinc transporter